MPLSLSFVETCYQSCCFGHFEPTHIIMSATRKEELRGLIMASPRLRSYSPSPWQEVNGPLGFNGAIVLGLPLFPEQYIWCANQDRPDKEGLNWRFEVPDV